MQIFPVLINQTFKMEKIIAFLTLFTCTIFCNAQVTPLAASTKFDTAIAVLNMGTFHMGFTSDANKTEFDEHNADNVKQVHEIAKKIAAFKPTVILVEAPPVQNEALLKKYTEYRHNPQQKFKNPSEIELLAFEVGRICNTERIYGIDYKEGYNYMIANKVRNDADTITYMGYMQMLDEMKKNYPEENMTVFELLKIANHPQYLDMLMNINADMLLHVSSPGKWEGAEEAAKFYHRNLVMYSNLNQIPLKKTDRVFILMGATHTAFFNMWLQRSPRYITENVLDYLK